LTNKRTCSFITDVRHDDMNVEAFCDAWKALKSVFGPGSALDPAGACSRRSPDRCHNIFMFTVLERRLM